MASLLAASALVGAQLPLKHIPLGGMIANMAKNGASQRQTYGRSNIHGTSSRIAGSR
jgi:hypothetical protein